MTTGRKHEFSACLFKIVLQPARSACLKGIFQNKPIPLMRGDLAGVAKTWLMR